MQLTAQQLSEVVVGLRTSRVAGGGSEHRRYNRLAVQARMQITTLVDEKACKTYTVLTQDVSFSGIGFLQTAPAKQGDRLVVHLPCPHSRILYVTATITHCRALADGIYGIGAEYKWEPGPELMRQLWQLEDGELQRLRASILG